MVYDWKISFMIMAFISFGLAFALKLIDLKALWEVMKQERSRQRI